MNMQTPEAQLIELTPLSLSDADWITQGLSTFDVAGNLTVPHPYSLADAHLWLTGTEFWKHPDNLRLKISHPGEGGIGVVSIRKVENMPTLGYWLSPRFWGRGIMSRAVRDTVARYYRQTVTDIIHSGVFHFNMASLAVQHKIGFMETGRSSIYCPARGGDIEHIDTELTRDAFEAAIQ